MSKGVWKRTKIRQNFIRFYNHTTMLPEKVVIETLDTALKWKRTGQINIGCWAIVPLDKK